MSTDDARPAVHAAAIDDRDRSAGRFPMLCACAICWLLAAAIGLAWLTDWNDVTTLFRQQREPYWLYGVTFFPSLILALVLQGVAARWRDPS